MYIVLEHIVSSSDFFQRPELSYSTQHLNMESPSVIIIGAGPAGISLAHTLKHKLHFDDFTVYEKLDGPGGTWRTNKYPGV